MSAENFMPDVSEAVRVVTEMLRPLCPCGYIRPGDDAAQYVIDPEELPELLELFWAVMALPKDPDFQGIDTFIPEIIAEFSDDCTFRSAYSHFHCFAKPEQLLKHFLFCLLPKERWEMIKRVHKPLAWCMVNLKLLPPRDDPDTIDLALTRPEELACSPRPRYPYLDHILRAYQCRNEESHVCPKQTRATLGIHEASLWICYLYTVKRHRAALQEALDRRSLKEFAKQDYCRRLVDVYEQENRSSGFRYVPLKWRCAGDEAPVGVEEMLTAHTPHMLLYGEAGSGKSIALRRMAGLAARKHGEDPTAPIPVLISLKDLENESILDCVCRKLQITADRQDYLLGSGHLLLLLDGLNEIVSHDPGRSTAMKKRGYIQEINQILNYFPLTRLVVTDRYITTFDAQCAIKTYELQKITEEDIRSFCREYLRDPQRLKGLTLSPAVVSFLNTPFKIRIYVDMLDSGMDHIPDTPEQLVGRYLQMIVDRECYEKCTLGVEDSSVFIHLLKKFSLAIFENQYDALPYKQTVDIFAQGLDELYLDRSLTTLCVKMAVELKILECTDRNYYNFAAEQYRSYYLSCAMDDVL